MPTDEAETSNAREVEGKGAAPRRKKKSAKSAKLSRPLTEKEINAPDLQTMIMMGVLGITTLVLWAFARSGCNYHPPRETRVPRKVTTAELTREPKSAAIEFQHRLLTYDFAGASEIAAGTAVKDVESEKSACGADCAKKKATLVNPVTAAVILDKTPFSARVKVTTYRIPGGERTFLNLVERSGAAWKVTARVPDAPGATLPAPSLAQTDPHAGLPNAPRFTINPVGTGTAAGSVPSAAAPTAPPSSARPNTAPPAPNTAPPAPKGAAGAVPGPAVTPKVAPQ